MRDIIGEKEMKVLAYIFCCSQFNSFVRGNSRNLIEKIKANKAKDVKK